MLKKENKKCIWLLLLIVASLLIPLTAYADIDPAWQTATGDIYQDPITGDIVFRSTDKEKTSNIYYQTQGFTISDAVMGEDGTPVLTGLGSIKIALGDPANASTVRNLGDGLIETTWVIPKEVIYEKIAATSQEWLNKILAGDGAMINFDAIFAVHDPANFTDPLLMGMSGRLDSETGLSDIGLTWDTSDPQQLLDLLSRYPWMEQYMPEHILQALIIGKEFTEQEAEQVDPELQAGTDYVTTIGKAEPYFCTWNYNPDGKFDIGDGIPTSEEIRNGYDADRWYGTAQVCNRKNAEKVWTFRGTIHWKETRTWKEYSSDGTLIEEHKIPVNCSSGYAYSVVRSVGYWYLAYPHFYDLKEVEAENEAYPNHTSHSYPDNETISMECVISGEDMAITSAKSNYTPSDAWHVNWNDALVANEDLKIDTSAETKQAAANAFIEAAESSVLSNGEIEVRNDLLQIDGNIYMNDNYYKYKDIGSNTYHAIGSGDYRPKTSDSGQEGHDETIPPDTANNKYTTELRVDYVERILNTRSILTDNKSGKDAIKNGYKENEPVVVHTPTVSPVEICDPDTHVRLDESTTSFEKLKTQLTSAATNPYVDYQLLLDGTYTIKFLPEEHTEHQGYDESGLVDTLYNKYCKFREVRFPFAVQIDHKIYEPDESGYTEWIDVSLDQDTPNLDSADDFTVDFYILPWAEENLRTTEDGIPEAHVIQYRVAPENVIDHNGVNHIEDEEWLKNQTFNGNPLYDYVSTYTVNVQVSGIIYGFQIVGINDKDAFYGPQEDGEKWGLSEAGFYPFCPEKEEKRSGTLNRVGEESVRYTIDGTLTNDWPVENTLPLSATRNNNLKDEGFLKLGHRFNFTLRTISNLWNETEDPDGEDFIYIKPSFRYYDLDGNEYEVDVYSDVLNNEGTEEYSYVPLGDEKDLQNKKPISISELMFDGSYYSREGRSYYDYDYIPISYQEDDAEFSKDKTNEFLYELKSLTNPDWPMDAYKNTNIYLHRETECYCLSSIVMNSRLRLLTGNIEQMERNLDKEGAALEYIEDKTESGAEYTVKPATNPELWDKFHMSMQTWFGSYYIPKNLYVTKDKFTFDTDEDGTEEEYDNIWDFTVDRGYIEGNEDFFITDGYLVVNFDIYTGNDGYSHLQYEGGNKDQWVIEGRPDTVIGGDIPFDNTITIPVESGDVGVIHLDRQRDEFYGVRYLRLN